MLLDLGYLPIITKANRITDYSAALIDRSYINFPQKVIKSGICLADISDHLPRFWTISTQLPAYAQASYYRDYSHFDRDLFEADLAQIDFCSLVNTKDGNISCNNIIQVLQDITDKHAPIRKVSSSKNKTAKKALDTQRHTYLYKKTTYDAFPPYGIKKNQTLNIITINLTRSKNYTRKNTYQLSFI